MTPEQMIEAVKSRADWARDVEEGQQKLNDAAGYWLTQSPDLQDQGIVMAVEALRKIVRHRGMDLVLRVGIDE